MPVVLIRSLVVAGLVAAGLLASPALEAQQVGQTPRLPVERLVLVAGRSLVLDTVFNLEQVQVTDAEVADYVVVGPREIIINGKKPGTISLFLWGEGRRVEYELVVDPAITTLQQSLQTLFPGEDIQVSVTQGALILSGRVSSNTVMLRAAEIAAASAPDQKLINMLQLPGGAGSQQVMLQVRFAEVNSRAVKELGASLFATRAGFVARGTTQQFPAPDFQDTVGDAAAGLVFADYLNLFFFQRDQGIGGVVKALEQNGSFESLAEPNLIAYNGQEASFLAGGEFPVVAVTGTGGVNVTFKEYGVRLKFRPTIAGDTIRLHVRPEVSALDFSNGITLAGFRIPALTTRYAETEVELRDGQSFAIAGLLDNMGQEDHAAIPGLSRIPIIGAIFRSRARREDRTELMVLITPRLVRPLDPDEVPALPSIARPGRGGGGGGGGGGLASYLQGGGGILDAPVPVRASGGGR
jgi:pilus assembly protein CpaC